jgi:hypothetical protein
MMSSFWTKQGPRDKIVADEEDPSVLLFSLGPLLPDRLRIPPDAPHGLAGQERKILETSSHACPQCSAVSPWHALGPSWRAGHELFCVQCFGACGWLLLEVPMASGGDPDPDRTIDFESIDPDM